MSTRLCLICVVLWVTAWPATLAAGPWLAPAHHGYLKVSYQYQFSAEQFNAQGERGPYDFGGESEAKFLIAETVVGITSRWQLTITVPVGLDVTFHQPAGDAIGRGVGEFWVVVAHQLNQGAWVNSIETGLKIPLQDGSGQQDLSRILLTQGQIDWLLRWNTGYSFWPTPAYAQASLGYLVRSANTSPSIEFQPGDEIWYRFDTGYRFWKDLLFGVSLDGIAGSNGTTTRLATELSESARSVTRLSTFLMLDVIGGFKGEIRYYHHLRGQNYPAGDIWELAAYFYF